VEDTAGLAEVGEPILKIGDFLPRFSLSLAADSLPPNRDLFTRKPSLKSWKGSHIVQVDRFLKPLEVEDAYGRSLSNRYDPRGFHQIGLFSPAPYGETAVLSADGYPSGADSLGDWVFYGNPPAHANGALSFTSPFNVRQRFDLSAGTSYRVECQIDSKTATEVAVKFEGTGGETWALKILPVLPGLHTYSTVLDSALWLDTPPAKGANLLVVYSNQNLERVDIKYLRAYPKAAEARTYLYDERGDLTQGVDGEGVSTYYEYDLFGKLVGIRNDEGVLLTAGSREQVNR
jgi:YD repeat-containing protein